MIKYLKRLLYAIAGKDYREWAYDYIFGEEIEKDLYVLFFNQISYMIRDHKIIFTDSTAITKLFLNTYGLYCDTDEEFDEVAVEFSKFMNAIYIENTEEENEEFDKINY